MKIPHMNLADQEVEDQVKFTICLLIVSFISIGCRIVDTSCTIFTAVQGETVLYGNNEDNHQRDPILGIYPPTESAYGSIRFGSRSREGKINFEGAVNEHGLVWDVNSTPSFKLEAEDWKLPLYGEDSFLSRITKEAKSVGEVMEIAKEYNYGESLANQIHIADRHGDAIIISAGSDHHIAFTRISGDPYLLSTNFNRAQPGKGPVDFRWDLASEYLNRLTGEQSLTPEFAMEILQAVSLHTITSYTLYSYVLDLKENHIYLVYMSQFQKIIKLNMDTLFQGGKRNIEMRFLFDHNTSTAGDESFKRFYMRFTIYRTLVIIGGILFLILIIFLILKFRKRRNRASDS